MPEPTLDPIALAERLRNGEDMSALKNPNTAFADLRNLDPISIADHLGAAAHGMPRLPATDRIEPKHWLGSAPGVDIVEPAGAAAVADVGDLLVWIGITPNALLRLEWESPNVGAYDWVALYDHDPVDPLKYMTSQWCWADNRTAGRYTTGTTLTDIATPYWAGYVVKAGGNYVLRATKKLEIPWHGVSASPNADGYITLRWTGPSTPSYYDYIALYDREPVDPKGYLSNMWCWALYHTAGEYVTGQKLEDVSVPFWVAYVTNSNGAYGIVASTKLEVPKRDIFLSEVHESEHDGIVAIERDVAVLNWTNTDHVGFWDYVALYDGKPETWDGYLTLQWCYATNCQSGSYRTATPTDPKNPTKYWLAYVSWANKQWQIQHSRQQNYEPTWMGDIAASISHRRLRDVVLPGSHDCGTYGITPDSPYTPDAPLDAGEIGKGVVISWSVTQQLSIAAQLDAGIRYFDLRVNYDTDRNDFYTCHALRGVSVDEVLNAVGDFISRSPNEVVLLDFNHFFTVTADFHQRLSKKIVGRLGKKMLPNSAGFEVTMQEIWNQGKNVIVAYKDDATVSAVPLLWRNDSIDSPWPEQWTDAGLKAWLIQHVIGKPQSRFWVLQGVITPNWPHIIAGFLGGKGLIDMGSALNPQVLRWLRDWRTGGASLNIVMLDFIDLSGLVPTVIAMNR